MRDDGASVTDAFTADALASDADAFTVDADWPVVAAVLAESTSSFSCAIDGVVVGA